MAVTFRPLASADAEAAAALIRRAFSAQDALTDPPSSALAETGPSLRAWLDGGGGGAVAADGAGLSAAVLWAERAGGLYCGRLAVDPAARGLGLARALMAEAEREARRRGLRRLHLKARLALPGNLAFFAALGFREVGREAHAGHDRPTTALMERRLDDDGGSVPGFPRPPLPEGG